MMLIYLSLKLSLQVQSEQNGSAIPTRYLEAIAASVAPRQLREVLRALLVDLSTLCAQVKQSRLESVQSRKRTHASSRKTCRECFFRNRVPSSSKFLIQKITSVLAPDGGVLCVVGSSGSGKTTLVCALAVVLSIPDWIPELELLEKSSSVFSRSPSGGFNVPESYQKDLRVYVHLTLGAFSSSTLHSGLALCAIPQMTQLQQLLQAWIGRIVAELRRISCDDRKVLEFKLEELEEDYSRGCDLASVVWSFTFLFKP